MIDDDTTLFLKLLINLRFIEYGVDPETNEEMIYRTGRGEAILKFLQSFDKNKSV